MKPTKRKALTAFAAFIMFLTCSFSVSAAGIIVGKNAVIRLNSQTSKLHCRDLTVTDRGKLYLGSGQIRRCRHFTLESGSFLSDGTGTITLCGTWRNDTSFQKSSGSLITFVDGCDVSHRVTGSGDTDGDGVSDKRESFADMNHDGLPDFLDDTLSAVHWVSPAPVHLLLMNEE